MVFNSIQIQGLNAQSSFGSVTAEGNEIPSDVGRGGEFVRPLITRGAKAFVTPIQANIDLNQVSASGEVFISATAKVIAMSSYISTEEISGEGQLGINDEDLLLLLVA